MSRSAAGGGRSGAGSRRAALAFRRGEPEAVESVRRYVRRVLHNGRLRLPAGDLPDLEQQVMTQVWQAAMRPEFDPHAGFWGFVETIAARRCVDALRRSRPQVELPESLADRGQGPLESALASERLRLARQVLGRLEAPCRELIELHAVRGLTYRQIAPLLGRTEGALRVQMHRCVQTARRLLDVAARPEGKSGEERQ